MERGRRYLFVATMMLAISTFTFVFAAHESSTANTFIASTLD